MSNVFPAIEPFATGHLPVAKGQEIFWETSGNPNGKPALYLHGGPGGGISSGYRRHYDPNKYFIVSFDQRGCGRSRPLATDPGVDLSTNTTQALISDIEILRQFLKIESWLICGISWGTTLALAYAQAHPTRVEQLVLALITTTSTSEVTWITEKMRNIFPGQWDEFANAVKANENQRLIDVYYEHITSSDLTVRENAAKAWCRWEDVHVSLDPKHKPSIRYEDPKFRLLFATLVIHYWKHAAFLGDPGILTSIEKIAHIPGVLIHGRLDISSPLAVAWEIHKAWKKSKLVVIDDEGHGGESMVKHLVSAIDGFAI